MIKINACNIHRLNIFHQMSLNGDELKGIKVKKGSAQDATFITSDHGHVKHEETRSEGKTRTSKDGSFTKKNIETVSDIRVIQ